LGPCFVHQNPLYGEFLGPKTDGSNDDGRPSDEAARR
jgi:hypothetical protein